MYWQDAQYLILDEIYFRACTAHAAAPLRVPHEGVMALCCFASAEEREAARRSKEIDRYLERERFRCWREVKILLLGTSGSGKSTFLKQMRILHGRGYTEENRLGFRPDIYATILNGMNDVILCLKEHQIPLQDSQNEKKCQVFVDLWHGVQPVGHSLTDVEFCSVYTKPLMSLWRDQGIQAAVEEANHYYLVGVAGMWSTWSNYFYFHNYYWP